MSLFHRTTEDELTEEVRALLKDAVKMVGKRCLSCPLYSEGCKNKDLEAVSILLKEIMKIYPHEVYSIIRTEVLSSIQPRSEIFLAEGKSMYPSINHGDLLIVRGDICIEKGDIILFYYKKELVVHRVIGRTGDIIFTSGDNCKGITETITTNSVIGKVSRIIKKEENPQMYDFLYKSICNLQDDKT